MAHTPDENVNNPTPILIESQQPQSNNAYVSQPMRETREIPHHNLADFEPHLGYAPDEQAVGGVPLPNTLRALSITHNLNPCTLQWEESFLLWWKGRNWII